MAHQPYNSVFFNPNKETPPQKPQTPSPPKKSPLPQSTPDLTARIVDWDHKKGFGYLSHKRQRIFLHRRDFAEHHKRPSVGDIILFNIGKNKHDRTCAINAIHKNDGGRFSLAALIALLALFILPALALTKLTIQLNIHPASLPIAALLINIITYTQYKSDKDKARKKLWRISESTLQFLALIGGWPAAYIAQKRLRHKCSKTPFQIIFWLMITLHQLAAYDYLNNWKYSKISIANPINSPPLHPENHPSSSPQ